MNAKTSYFNLTIFKKNLTIFSPIWIVYLLILFLQMPFSIWTIIQRSEGYQSYYYTASDLANTINTLIMQSAANQFSITFQALYALICAGIVFRYLYNSRSAGTIHALPLKRICLYISNLLSGLVMILIPQCLIVLLTVPIILFKGYGNLTCLFSAFGMMVGYSFFFYCLAIFCSMLVGHLLALPAMFGFFNFFILIAEYIFRGIMSILLFGFSFESQPISLSYLSPLYYFYITITTMTDKKTPYYNSSAVTAVVIYATIGIILLLLSYLIYSKRKIETSGDPVAVKKLQPLFKFAFTFVTSCGISFLIYMALIQNTYRNTSNFVFLFILFIISGIVCSYSYEMLLQKSFRVLKKGLTGACIYSIAIIIAVLFIKVDLFSFITKTPDSVNVKKVTVTVNSANIVSTDSSSIKEMIEIQKQIIGQKSTITDKTSDLSKSYDPDNNESIYTVNINYELRNNKKLVRTYSIPVSKESFSDTDSYAGKLKSFMDTPQNLLDSISYSNNKHMILASINIDPYTYNDTDAKAKKNSNNAESYAITDYNMAELFKAIQKDIELGALKMDTFMNSNDNNILYSMSLFYNSDSSEVYHNNYYSFFVTKDCVNVLNFIDKYKSDYTVTKSY